MSLHIPSSNVKSKYLKSLPIGTIFKDPRNNYNYEIVEKKINQTLTKAALPYISVPEKFLKLENPNRANILSFMKQRLLELEKINGQLIQRTGKSTFQQIKELIGDDNENHETDTHIYHLNSGIIFPLKKKNYSSNEEAYKSLEEAKTEMWKEPKNVQQAMSKQPSIQTKLLELLLSGKQTVEKDVRVVSFI